MLTAILLCTFVCTFACTFGALAQLVERDNGIVEVNGSTPLRSSPLVYLILLFFNN